MQNILLGILSIPFLYINFKIISSDLKYKKIPNKYLLYMLFILPFYYLYTFLYFDINYLFFPIQIILTIIISFVLYYYGIWSAGDAKYLLVLALFLPQIGIITFVGNIALITIVYLFLYFIWFYFGKCLFDFNYTKSLYTQIYNDLGDKLSIFFKHNNGNYSKKIIFFRILKLILLFLILFVSIRLARLYLFADIMDSTYFKELMKLAKSYSIYFIILLGLLFLGIIYFFKFLINNLKKYLLKRIEFRNESTLDIYLILIMLYVLICFVIYEYSINPNEIKTYLFKILTLSIWLWILYKILFYSYEVTFQIAESYFINIKDLNEGDIVDKNYLKRLFGEQKCLGFKNETGLLSPEPAKYFLNLENPINQDDKLLLQNIYSIVNEYQSNSSGTNENNTIKILNTFAFGGYIFFGFTLTFFLGNYIINFLTKIVIDYIKYHF